MHPMAITSIPMWIRYLVSTHDAVSSDRADVLLCTCSLRVCSVRLRLESNSSQPRHCMAASAFASADLRVSTKNKPHNPLPLQFADFSR